MMRTVLSTNDDQSVATIGLNRDREAALLVVRDLCHDLVEPAVTIQMLARAAEIESSSDAASSLRLRQIGEEARRINDLCEHFLDNPRVPTSVRLDILIADYLSGRRFYYEGTFDVVTEPVTTMVPAAVVMRIVSNLVDNACRVAGPRGRVRLTVEPESDMARIVVSDSGGGMGSAPPGKASLGLGIAEGLAQQCGGALATSMSDLGGWQVTMILPAAGPRAATKEVK